MPAASPIVIAHRGASGYLPEHTLAAKAMAHAMGADFLEQDVVLSRDDVPVVLHDIRLESVCDVADRFRERSREDGHYYAIDFTLAELKELRLHERVDAEGAMIFPNRFPLGRSAFQIPTLEEELQLIQGLNHSTGRVAGIYPELKQPGWHRREGRDLSRMVLPILRRYGYATKADPCWVQCFEWDEVKRIRLDLGWEGRLLLLLDGSGKDAELTAEDFRPIAAVADGVGPSIEAIVNGSSPSRREVTGFVRNAHAANLLVHPYTARADALPPTAATLDDLMDVLIVQAGVDGIFTDFPDLAVQWLRCHGSGDPGHGRSGETCV